METKNQAPPQAPPTAEDCIERFISGHETPGQQRAFMVAHGFESFEIDVVLRQVKAARDFHCDMRAALSAGRLDADAGGCAT